jgi:hypothetical protein
MSLWTLVNLYHQRSPSHTGGISPPKFAKMSAPHTWFGDPPAVFSLFAHGTPVARLLANPCYFSLAIMWPKADFTAHDEVGVILSF